MTYNPATDFLGLWRNIAGAVSKVEMPGLDYVVAALARAGVITLSVSATAPVVSQSTTAWLQAAVPSYSAEGVLQLWNPVTSAYAAATPALFFEMLQASAGENGVSWWTSAGGPPINTVGNNGDFAIRTDEPGGVYGPKAAGAWPASPLPGTTDIIGSEQLDLTFGATEGALIYRGPDVWEALGIGASTDLLSSNGSVPGWQTINQILDAFYGTTIGSILYRNTGAGWQGLPPGTAGLVLNTGGPGANPFWATATPEFPSGTVMLFQQTAAPTGWTKQTAINDYGLRVTSGSVGVTAGTAFSSVFAQTVTGNTTISQATMPSHSHTSNAMEYTQTYGVGTGADLVPGGAAATINSTGSDGAHDHSVNLTLAYVDVIIASKN